MADNKINLILGVRDKATPALKGVRGQLKRFQGDMKRGFFMGTGLGASMMMAQGIRAIGDAFGDTINTVAEFDDAMTKSLAIMGDVSETMREDMAGAAVEVAKATTFSAKEAADAYYFLASAGLDAGQSVKALPTVAQFAQAGAFDLAQATDLLTDAQSALGLTVEDTVQNIRNMTEVGDVLVKANTLANASVEQFSKALTSKAGAALKAFGIDLEEGVAVLAAFADQGVKAEEAGNALDRILRLLPDLALKNADAFEDMGIEVFDSAGEMNNLGDIISQMTGAMHGLSDAGVQAALSQLGFKARVQGVIKPLLGTGAAILEYELGLRQAAGTMKSVADKQLESFRSKVALLHSELAALQLTIGGPLVDALGEMATILDKSVLPVLQAFVDQMVNPDEIILARNAEKAWDLIADKFELTEKQLESLRKAGAAAGVTIDRQLFRAIDQFDPTDIEEVARVIQSLGGDQLTRQMMAAGGSMQFWSSSTGRAILRTRELEATLTSFNKSLSDFSDVRHIDNVRVAIKRTREAMERAAQKDDSAAWARRKARLEDLRGQRNESKQAESAMKAWKQRNRNEKKGLAEVKAKRKEERREIRMVAKSHGTTTKKVKTLLAEQEGDMDKVRDALKAEGEEAQATKGDFEELGQSDPVVTITVDNTQANAELRESIALLNALTGYHGITVTAHGSSKAPYEHPHTGGMVKAGQTVVVRQNEALVTPASQTAVVPLDGPGSHAGGGGTIHTHVYLDGREIASVVDERLGRRAATQGRNSNYRTAN